MVAASPLAFQGLPTDIVTSGQPFQKRRGQNHQVEALLHTNLRLKGKKGPPDEKPKRPTRLVPRRSSAYARGAAPKGRGVFHKTRLSDIPRQRLHKAIHCLVEAQPTDRPPQSSRKIGLREAGRRVVWLNPSAALGDTSPFRGGNPH